MRLMRGPRRPAWRWRLRERSGHARLETHAIRPSSCLRPQACLSRPARAASRCWPPFPTSTTPCRARAGPLLRSAPPHLWGGAWRSQTEAPGRRGSSLQAPMKFDDRGHGPVAHLLVDAEDGRVVNVVGGAHPGRARFDRLADGLVLQRAADTAAAHRACRARVRGRRHAAHNRVFEDGCSNDGVALPGDPVPVLADARIFEPEARPLIQGQHAPGHAGRDVLLGLDGPVVQLLVLRRIALLVQRVQRYTLLLHSAPALLARDENLVSIRDQVELGDPRTAVLAIADALKGRDILLEVRADPGHRGRRALRPQPVLPNH